MKLQASPGPYRWQKEAWAGRVQSSSLRISQEVEIVPGCAVTVSPPPSPFFAPASPGPGREVRSWIGWTTRLGKTTRSGVWFFRGALQGEGVFLALSAAREWVKKGSYHTVWSVPLPPPTPLSSCSCSYAYGQGPAVGPQSGERCWPLLT